MILEKRKPTTAIQIYNRFFGLIARDTGTFYIDWDGMFVDVGSAVNAHLCRREARPSLFVSIFAGETTCRKLNCTSQQQIVQNIRNQRI